MAKIIKKEEKKEIKVEKKGITNEEFLSHPPVTFSSDKCGRCAGTGSASPTTVCPQCIGSGYEPIK